MSILQNKLVWKSIEALHDEAVAAPVDAASDTLVIKSYPAATLHTAPIDPDDHAGDVMTRIDNLLQQLGADDAIPKNAPENAPKNLSTSAPPHLPQDLNATSEIDEEEMAETQTAITHTAIIADITAETDLPEADPTSSAVGLQDTALGENLGDDSPANHSPADDAFGGDSSEADTALADIAAAIDQARQQSAQVRSSEPMTFDDNDTKAAEAPIDFDALTAKFVDEMRDTVSTMIATELPTMVRQAVTDAFKDLPVAAIDPAAKTAISKKAAPKKPASKKMAQKNTNVKKTASKKAAGKKVAPKKAI